MLNQIQSRQAGTISFNIDMQNRKGKQSTDKAKYELDYDKLTDETKI